MSWWCFLLVLLSLFQTCFLSSPSSPHFCLHDERSALLQLKQKNYLVPTKFNYPIPPYSYNPVPPYSSHHSLMSWKPDTDCCYWEGITCDGTTGHVVGLILSNLAFSGSIYSNSSLFHLRHLQMLNLSYNHFSGPIPSQISLLTDLVSLNLSMNSFGGQIPSEISWLTKLVSLDLSFNGYYQLEISQLEIPNLGAFVRNLSSLSELHLNGVNLSAQNNRGWCHDISSALPNLQVLSMRDCSLTGPLDASISSLRFLSKLFLENNPNLSCTVPTSLMNLTSFKFLCLRECGLHGEFPGDFFHQPNMKHIDLYGNPLLSVHLPELPRVNSTLQYLSIGYTKFQGKLPNSIGNLKFLKYFSVGGLNLSGPVPPFLANLTHLNHLDLSYDSFSGPIPSFFRGSFPNLERLYLEYNFLQGTIHSYLFFLPSLRTLVLSNNQFHGVMDEPIHNISSFSFPRIFDLSVNFLKGQELMRSISKIKGTFDVLDLSFNDFSYIAEDTSLSFERLSINRSGDNLVNAQIQGLKMISCNISKFPDFLRNQKELALLYIHQNRISKFPDFLRDLKALSYLDISSNRIDGAIPKWIWHQNLIYLNLSNNFFTAPCFLQTFNQSNSHEFVSPILGNLTSFLSEVSLLFSISGNKLTGKIPFSICKAIHLEILDLSSNQLSGPIPTCFGSSNLRVLNLESNQLHGPIPPTFKNGCNLHSLKLSRNLLQGKVPRSLGNCRELKLLDIANNKLNDTFPHWLENLSELRVLVMRSNKFGGPILPIPHTDSPFPSLQYIDLSVNNFTGNLPLHYICHWKAMMFDEDASELSYASELNSAYFQQYIGYYRDTVAIILKGQCLEMPRILMTFTNVDLSSNNFEGRIPYALGNLKALKFLNLSRNSLSGQIPFSLGYLSELESLDLSRNKLSGEIPRQLTSLTFLSTLKLSYNNFTGSIPQGNQFDTFSNDSYEGNAGLCGFPLSRKCGITDRALPPASLVQQKDDSSCPLDWTFALVGYCSGLIVGLVIGWQLFWRKNRYSKFISRVVTSKCRKGSRKIIKHSNERK